MQHHTSFHVCLGWVCAALLLTPLAVAGAAGASTNGLSFESVGRGLIPRDVVASLAQDRQGFIWIGTGDGLVRYDGYHFHPVEHEVTEPARRNLGWVRAIHSARDGRVWIGTERDGLAVYDPVTGKVRLLDGAASATAQPLITALAEDREGRIWAGRLGAGIERVAADKRPAERFVATGETGSLPDDRVHALHVGRDGTLWVGTWQGLSRRRPGSDSFEPVFSAQGLAPSLYGQTVQALREAADGRLWVGTQQGQLALIEPADGSGRFLQAAATGPRGAVNSLAAQGREIWVGTAQGVEVHDADSAGLIRQARHDPRRAGGLAGAEVTALMTDQAGWVWVGGLGVGLQRHNPGNLSIRLRGTDFDGPPDRRFDGNAHALLALDDGQLWAATAQTPVLRLDASLAAVGRVDLPGDGAGMPITRVTAMAQRADGSVWLAAQDTLVRAAQDGRVLQTLRHSAGEIVRLYTARDGVLWLGSRDGLFRLRPGASALQRAALTGGGVLQGGVFAITESPDDELWIGGVQGLHRWPLGAAALEKVDSPTGAGPGSGIVLGLLFDGQGRLWVDTAVTGLHRRLSWDGRSATFDAVSVRHGIHNRPFGANLMLDGRGRVWTQQYVYDPGADRLFELNTADGKDIGMGWFFSYARMADGRMVFGGSRAMLVVQPDRYEPSSYMPPLVISSLRVDGRLGGGAGGASIVLAPGQRQFSVEFAALDYSDPQRIRYAYRLDGSDTDWTQTSADFRVASYGSLAPGEYRLRIKSTNRSGQWRLDELAIPVTVVPAWWQHRLSHAAAALIALAALYAYIQLRTRGLRARQRALEAKVRDRTAELERLTLALQAESAALEQASMTDPLSGMRNRRFLTQYIDSDVALAVRQHESGNHADNADLVFFLFDIDHFKDINDRLGHAAGDAVIQQMRDRLSPVFRNSDHIVRWGGEEFLVVARGTSRRHAPELAERARAAVADTLFRVDDGPDLHVTTSIGFACLPLASDAPRLVDWSQTVNMADLALLQAKAAGRDRWFGVIDSGSLEASTLGESGRPADWLASGQLTVAKSRMAAGFGNLYF